MFINGIYVRMRRYTLSELEQLTGIMASTIRIWERRFKILKPHRTDTNRKWYDDDDLKHIINICAIYRSGIKISKIAKYSRSELEQKVAILSKDSLSYDTQIESLIDAMINLNENAVNEILLRSIINKGFEETFTDVVFPFLRRVGIMWHTGSLNSGTEHFISDIFKRRLIATIDALPPAIDTDRKRIIMYLPENELHEMGLLFYAYILRRMGHEVLYLGQATPFNAVVEINELRHSDMIVTGALSDLSFEKPEDYLNRLSTTFIMQKILVSGLLADKADHNHYHNIFTLRSVSDLKNYIS